MRGRMRSRAPPLLAALLRHAAAYGDKTFESTVEKMIKPALRLLFPLGRPEPQGDGGGVLMLYVRNGLYDVSARPGDEEPEATTAARVLRQLMATGAPVIGPRGTSTPIRRYPMTLMTDNATLRHLRADARLWDAHIVLDPEPAHRALMDGGFGKGRRGGAATSEAAGAVDEAAYTRRGTNVLNTKNASVRLRVFYAWKLMALASSPYRTTLFIDNDVLVLSRTLVDDMLKRSLRLSDMAIAMDPSRPPAWTREHQRRKDLATRAGTVVGAPDMYSRGVPPLCTCMVAYRRTPSVERLLLLAAARLLLLTHPFDPTAPTRQRVRQTDQEMLWFQLAHGRPDAALRLLVLPEEWICPAYWPSHPKGNRYAYYFYLVSAIAAGRRPTWRTSWDEYPCHAAHFHHSDYHLRRARPPLTPAAIRLFHERVGRGAMAKPGCPASSPRSDPEPRPGLECSHYAWGLAPALPERRLLAELEQHYNVTLVARPAAAARSTKT